MCAVSMYSIYTLKVWRALAWRANLQNVSIVVVSGGVLRWGPALAPRWYARHRLAIVSATRLFCMLLPVVTSMAAFDAVPPPRINVRARGARQGGGGGRAEGCMVRGVRAQRGA